MSGGWENGCEISMCESAEPCIVGGTFTHAALQRAGSSLEHSVNYGHRVPVRSKEGLQSHRFCCRYERGLPSATLPLQWDLIPHGTSGSGKNRPLEQALPRGGCTQRGGGGLQLTNIEFMAKILSNYTGELLKQHERLSHWNRRNHIFELVWTMSCDSPWLAAGWSAWTFWPRPASVMTCSFVKLTVKGDEGKEFAEQW